MDTAALYSPAASPPRLSGVLDGSDELIALLRLLRKTGINGRLSLTTDAWSGELFLARGQILAVTCGANHGSAVLAAMLEDLSGKAFSLHPWAMLEDVTARFDNDTLRRFEDMPRVPGKLADAGSRIAGPDTQRQALIESLASDVLGRVRWPIDALEVTAVLESLGITDEVAVQRYTAPDVFVLAEEVHARFALRGDRHAE
jgi:hypothetical protein